MRLLLCVREESGADDVPDVESGGYNLFYSVLVVPGILSVSYTHLTLPTICSV